MAPNGRYAEYTGANYLRQRLVLAILSARPVRITRIRARDQDPGLRDCEAALLRLLDKVSFVIFIRDSRLVGKDHLVPTERHPLFYMHRPA